MESLDAQTVVQDLLRPTEEAKVAIDVRPSLEDDLDDTDTWLGADVSPRRKILAVVMHLHPSSNQEQACVFVFNSRPRMPSSPIEYIVERIFPIMGDFSISMSQPRRSTVDVSPPASSSALRQSFTELSVTITPGHDPELEPLVLLTNDIAGLRAVLDECKRFKEKSTHQTDDDFDFEPFGWVESYVVDDSWPPFLAPFPTDLRKLHKPVQTRLSPATAGLPGNDVADIEIIREEWIRQRLHDGLYAHGEKSELNIRIGTFNVNGKFPSQDLSAWVGGRPNASSLIPPLKEISPLSLGEAARDVSSTDLEEAVQESLKETDDASASDTAFSAESEAQEDVSEDATLAPPAEVVEDSSDPDMLVLGFQELDLSTEALLYSTKTVREEAWCLAIFAGLGEKAVLYEKLASKQLVGMLLVVIVKKRLRENFSDIATSSVGIGIMGMLGNKGATAIRILYTPKPSIPPVGADVPEDTRVRPTVLTFVNSHLAAFDEMFEKRNTDFHDLSKRLVFDSDLHTDGPAGADSGFAAAPTTLSIFDSDVLFWMGDLNYRLTLPDADVRALLAAGDDALREANFELLRSSDQLVLAMRQHKAFEHFIEPPVMHPPSYRFGWGLATDSNGYDMKRKPAWTDRVLYMSAGYVQVTQGSYTSHGNITMSDHRPVSAVFALQVPVVGEAEYGAEVERLWKDVSRFENSDARPTLKVLPATVDFGDIRYETPVERAVEVENVGQVPCAFRMVAQGPNADACPYWLRAAPMMGLVLPGEKVLVRITAHVDRETAGRFSAGPTRLEDTLVLHTSLGRDHFVAVTGNYARSCFGTSVAWLVRVPGPVRALETSGELLPEDRGANAPRELMRLVNWLMSRETDVPDLFLTPGDEEMVRQIREDLDTGAEFSTDTADEPKAARAFADALVLFLGSLSEPVIPYPVQGRCTQVSSRDEAFEVLDQFPIVNVNILISLTAFLHYIGQQDGSQVRTEQLVAVFTPVLFGDQRATTPPSSVIAKRRFLRYFVA